jgi:5,10-methylenetetrahydromethanopterin reductase
VYVTLAHCAGHHAHPARLAGHHAGDAIRLAASAAATLRSWPNRTMVGIGSGDSAAYNIGLKAVSLAELREYALAIRSLLTTGRADYHGTTARFTWSRVPVPLFLAASGPKTLRLAGQIADGAVIRTGLTPEIVGTPSPSAAGAREGRSGSPRSTSGGGPASMSGQAMRRRWRRSRPRWPWPATT